MKNDVQGMFLTVNQKLVVVRFGSADFRAIVDNPIQRNVAGGMMINYTNNETNRKPE